MVMRMLDLDFDVLADLSFDAFTINKSPTRDFLPDLSANPNGRMTTAWSPGLSHVACRGFK